MKKLLLLIILMSATTSFAQVTASDATLTVCETNTDGMATFDLTQADNEVLNGQSAASFQVTYYSTNADAQAAINELQPIYMNVSPYTETVYARVEDLGSGSYAISNLYLEVGEQVIANSAQDMVACGTQGFGDFDLTMSESAILGSQSPTNVQVSFYVSQADAASGISEIVNPSSYTNVANPQYIYVRVEDVNSDCFAMTDFVISAMDCTQDTDTDLVVTGDEDVNGDGNLVNDDTDDNDIPNYQDEDDDGDGILTRNEDYNENGDPRDDDTNSNEIPDYLEAEVALSVNPVRTSNFSIYPNPAKESVTLQFEQSTAITTFTLYTIEGKQLREYTFPEVRTSYALDISELSAGIYFVSIPTKTGQVTKKLIVE